MCSFFAAFVAVAVRYFAIVFDADGFIVAISALCPPLSHSLSPSLSRHFFSCCLCSSPSTLLLMLWHCFDAPVYVCLCVDHERSATASLWAIRSHFLSFVRWAHISKEFSHLCVCVYVRYLATIAAYGLRCVRACVRMLRRTIGGIFPFSNHVCSFVHMLYRNVIFCCVAFNKTTLYNKK